MIVREQLNILSDQAQFRTVIGDRIDRVTTIGGDFHGDFFIAQHEEYPRGAFDMLGQYQPYAPLANERGLSAYHSVEPNLVLSLFYWADSLGIPAAEQLGMWQQALGYIQENQAKAKLFATTAEQAGSSEDRYALRDVEVYKEAVLKGECNVAKTNAQGFHNRGYFMMLSGIHLDTGIEVFVSPEDKLVLLPVQATEEAGNEAARFADRLSRSMSFDRSEVQGLMDTILGQAAFGHGRTQIGTLVKMLRARFEPVDSASAGSA